MDTQTLERISQLEGQVQTLVSALATQSAEIDYLRKELAEESVARANADRALHISLRTGRPLPDDFGG